MSKICLGLEKHFTFGEKKAQCGGLICKVSTSLLLPTDN